jgi:SPOR domain
MADNTYRSYRNHDAGQAPEDPLAELARLIGQNDPADDYRRDAGRASAALLGEPSGGQDWPADDRYADPDQPAQDEFGERYDAPRSADPYVPYRPPLASREVEYDAPAADQFPAPRSKFNGARDDATGYAVAQPRYRDEELSSEPQGQQLPAFAPQARDDRYQYEDQEADGADDQSYAAEDYDEDAPNPRRRGGLVVIAAVLAVAVFGTAGAFAYRAMFGGSMLPSLPPIIKADNGPNKIMPNAGNAQSNAQANSADSAEKLVPRQENPVDVPAPANPTPRVVSTIPVFPDVGASPSSAMAAGAPNMPAPPASVTPAPASVTPAPAMATPSPFASAAPPPPLVMPSTAPAGGPDTRKIHTVAIRPDQSGGADAATQSPPARVTAPRPVAAPMPSSASRAVAAPPAGGNAPLSIVPSQDGAPTPVPVRPRTAMTQPVPLNSSAAAAAAPSAGGSYAVQVSSQRSEAEAQTSFRALQAKFPGQLGGQQPMVRRADLGTKGVYYRALVGPYASMEQAAGVCSSLKAAGGSCIVQRN